MIRQVCIFLIRIYQYGISPMLGQNCRHTPTCSQYSVEAIQEWGVLKGVILGVKRLSKCHPWGTHGHDHLKGKKRYDGNKRTRRNASVEPSI